jgi:hypothetical protein
MAGWWAFRQKDGGQAGAEIVMCNDWSAQAEDYSCQ